MVGDRLAVAQQRRRGSVRPRSDAENTQGRGRAPRHRSRWLLPQEEGIDGVVGVIRMAPALVPIGMPSSRPKSAAARVHRRCVSGAGNARYGRRRGGWRCGKTAARIVRHDVVEIDERIKLEAMRGVVVGGLLVEEMAVGIGAGGDIADMVAALALRSLPAALSIGAFSAIRLVAVERKGSSALSFQGLPRSYRRSGTRWESNFPLPSRITFCNVTRRREYRGTPCMNTPSRGNG